ncbi:hypothetical protein ARSQ2_01656 [Arsenophonus endosymbiont of Bemisia tabaci Q2]|nr:hypothetical protein ARSQ2_01656 [Arsenophonus endosymbiont of Bemisia tabaci Q2]
MTGFHQLSKMLLFLLSLMAILLTRLKPEQLLHYTGACDALMIGRAAQGRPWIFREIQHYLETGELLPPMPIGEVQCLMQAHVKELHDFYSLSKGIPHRTQGCLLVLKRTCT